MALDVIERLYKLTVDGTAAARSLGEIERATASLDKRLGDSIDSITKFGKALAAAVSVGAIVHGFQRIIDSMDELSKDSQKIGIAAEELQRIRFAADLSGVSAENLNAAMVRLSLAMSNLGDKGNKAAGVLRAFGVKSTDDSVTALKKFADGIEKMPDGFAKTAAAADLFGKKLGTGMIPLLGQGAEEFEKLIKSADEFGGVVSEKTLKQAEEFNDNLTRLERTASGVGRQLTAAMLPALVAITNALVDAAKEGEGFKKNGEGLGETIISLTTSAMWLGEQLQEIVLLVGAVGAAFLHPLEAGSLVEMFKAGFKSPLTALRIMRELSADIDELQKNHARNVERLQAAFEKAKNAPAASTPKKTGGAPDDPLAAAEAAAKAAREAEKALREKEKAEKDAADALQRHLQFEAQFNAVTQAQNAIQTDAEKIATAIVRQRIAMTQAVEDHAAAVEIETARLDALDEMFTNGTPEVKKWAAAQLVATAAAQGVTTTLVKERDEVDALNESFSGFVSDAARSAGHLSDAFKKMAQTIVTELLKIWAKRYIIDAIFGTTTKAATGAVFDGGKVVPFARGGVISRPVMFPMALAGEAGPEAILPLRRAADGNLGVQSKVSPLNVTVNNYADATVTTRRTGPNDLEVIVEQTRKAIAADLRTGGTLVARSFEQAYGIGRGAAAAF